MRYLSRIATLATVMVLVFCSMSFSTPKAEASSAYWQPYKVGEIHGTRVRRVQQRAQIQAPERILRRGARIRPRTENKMRRTSARHIRDNAERLLERSRIRIYLRGTPRFQRTTE